MLVEIGIVLAMPREHRVLALLLLREGIEFLHILVAQREIKDVDILLNPRCGRGLGQHGTSVLQCPSDEHLCRALAMLLRNSLHNGILEQSAIRTRSERGIRLEDDPFSRTQLTHLLRWEQWMALVLTYCRQWQALASTECHELSQLPR